MKISSSLLSGSSFRYAFAVNLVYNNGFFLVEEASRGANQSCPNCRLSMLSTFSPVVNKTVLWSSSCLFLDATEFFINKYGYKISNILFNEIFYKEDLELFAKVDNALKHLLNSVKVVSGVRDLDFGLDKFASVTFKKLIITEIDLIDLDFFIKCSELIQGKAYKYVGISEDDGLLHDQMKHKVRKIITGVWVWCYIPR